MRIGMQTWGSHGDNRPMLVEGLQAAGHAVHRMTTRVDSGASQDLHSARTRAVAAAMARVDGVAAAVAPITQRFASGPAQERAAPSTHIPDQAQSP